MLSGGGLFLDSLVVDSAVTSVSPARGEETALRIAGDGWEAVYSFEEGSSFLKREFTWQIPQGTDELQLGALSPYLNTTEEKYDRERGFIGTYSEDDAGMSSSVYVTSGLPAIYSNVFNNAEDSVAVSMVLDREQSSAVFQLACRFFNDSRASARLGFYSASSDTVLATPYRYVDYVELSDGETTDYYDQLGMIRAQLTRVSPIDYDALAASDNKTVQDYDTLAVGLVNELLGRPRDQRVAAVLLCSLRLFHGLGRILYVAHDPARAGQVRGLYGRCGADGKDRTARARVHADGERAQLDRRPQRLRRFSALFVCRLLFGRRQPRNGVQCDRYLQVF